MTNSEWLRHLRMCWVDDCRVDVGDCTRLVEIADTIDRLTKDNKKLRTEIGGFFHLDDLRRAMIDTADENKRLTTALEAADVLVKWLDMIVEDGGLVKNDLLLLPADLDRYKAAREAK
jgi:hypothetical protein